MGDSSRLRSLLGVNERTGDWVGLGCFGGLDTGQAGTIGPSTGGNLELDVIVVCRNNRREVLGGRSVVGVNGGLGDARARKCSLENRGLGLILLLPLGLPHLVITGGVSKGGEAVGISSDILRGDILSGASCRSRRRGTSTIKVDARRVLAGNDLVDVSTEALFTKLYLSLVNTLNAVAAKVGLVNDEAARAVFTSGHTVGDVSKEDASGANDVLVQVLVGGLGNINHGVWAGTSAVGNPLDFGGDNRRHGLECSQTIVSAGGKCEAVGIAVGANEGTRAKEVSANLVCDTANASATDADDAADNLRGAALGNRTLEGLVVVGRHVESLLKGWFKARWLK